MPTYEIDVPGGAGWSVVLRRHQALRLTALGPRPNVAMLAFAVADPTERLNIPDTLKSQMSAVVRPPMTLMSDMGTALLSVTASSLDWHDAMTGHSLDPDVEQRFGTSSYQQARNDVRRSARSCLLEELRAHGLDVRDLHATVNWFTKITPAGDDRGSLAFTEGHATDCDFVDLRAEVDVLLVLATSPHPLDPSTTWDPSPIRAAINQKPPPGPDDPSRNFRAETARSLAVAERTWS